ncbi:hypothetical protein SLE2022_265560 [Rubroshorea leprosula]
MDRIRQRLFRKATRVENRGQELLVFRVMQGGVNGDTIMEEIIGSHEHIYVFPTTLFRNDSKENPVSVYVHLVGIGVQQSQWWTPIDPSMIKYNAKVLLAGHASAEIPIDAVPRKGTEFGRRRLLSFSSGSLVFVFRLSSASLRFAHLFDYGFAELLLT